MSSATHVHQSQAIDLSWVEFSEEEADPCRVIDCSYESTYEGVWHLTCSCWGDSIWPYCESHGVKFRDNFVGVDKLCAECLAPLKLILIRRRSHGS